MRKTRAEANGVPIISPSKIHSRIHLKQPLQLSRMLINSKKYSYYSKDALKQKRNTIKLLKPWRKPKLHKMKLTREWKRLIKRSLKLTSELVKQKRTEKLQREPVVEKTEKSIISKIKLRTYRLSSSVKRKLLRGKMSYMHSDPMNKGQWLLS